MFKLIFFSLENRARILDLGVYFVRLSPKRLHLKSSAQFLMKKKFGSIATTIYLYV